MAIHFEVQADDVSDLNALNLTKLLKVLLHLEAKAAGIDERGVDVALNISAADGGEDGRIAWQGGPDSTNFLPCRLIQFQSKATTMTPAKCADEIVGKNGKLKPMVEHVLENDGSYIVFTTKSLNKQQIQARIVAIRKKLASLGKEYAGTARLDVYDAAKIQGWVNNFLPAIAAVLNWTGKPIIRGLQTWEEWEQYDDFQVFKYVEDEQRSNDSKTLRESLAQPRSCGRIIGLSGLGKTRMALELCRDRNETDHFSKRVVYFNAAFSNEDLPAHFRDWIRNQLDGLVVVDNCPLDLHKALRKEVEHRDSRLALLTLDFNLEIDNTDTIKLTQVSSELIKKMLEPIYGTRIADLDRIISFAQGFPLMAVFLAQARLDKTEKLGSLTDDDILRKMLWGHREPDLEQLAILRTCSLFDKFGFDDSASEEYEFIANTLTRIDRDSFYSCVKQFEERGIIDRRGRYRRIVPTPLAVRLASEWWSSTSPQSQVEFISTDLPGGLTESLCEQIAKLDFLPEVKRLTENLCGKQGPFGQAEVILSTRGSRLFRSLVEVNPIVTSSVLYEILSTFDIEQRSEIIGDVRRNLVWTLEKLCFHEAAFVKSATCLLWLAESENETWSNNSTGQFLQLFHTFLSGTEAPPELRFVVIDSALRSPHPSTIRLGIKALGAAIDQHSGTRMVGAEFQGSGEPLVEWHPKIWQEAFDYWKGAIARLTEFAIQDNELGEEAKNIIGSHIRGLAVRSFDVMAALENSIRRIVGVKGPLWPVALERIKDTIEFDTKRMPTEAVQTLNSWVSILTPSALSDRLALIVSTPPWEHKKDQEGHYIDVAALNAEKLAEELSNDIAQVVPYLRDLMVNEQRQAVNFARSLVKWSGKWEPLFSRSVELLLEIENPNYVLLIGLMQGIYLLNPKKWDEQLSEFEMEHQLNRYYTHMTTTGTVSEQHLNVVVKLLKSGRIQLQDLLVYSYGRPIDHIPPTSITKFTKVVRALSNRAAWIALDVLFMYCYGSEDKWRNCRSEFQLLLSEIEFEGDESSRQQQHTYHWHETAKKLLNERNVDFAVMLTNKILSSCKSGIGFSDLHHYVQPIMRLLAKEYGEQIWPLVSRSIESAEPVEGYRIGQLFSKEDNSSGRTESILAELSEEILNDWCDKYPNTAPYFIARATDVYIDENDSYSLSPRVQMIIDRFGDNEDILSEISANMGTFGWSGSLVPILEKEIPALTPLKTHPKERVRAWAERRIAYLEQSKQREQRRDEERDWGIY